MSKSRAPRTYFVYVIELDPPACAERRSPCKGKKCGRQPVYVGQSALTAEERFANHRRGYKANKLVQGHGRRLRPDLAPTLEFDSRGEAEAAEAELAEELRRKGYCVSGGH
jgi:predicted GIY-YIG superfamily endonuclease